MKKFRFRLERVHQMREAVKAEKLRELQVARGKVLEIEQRIADLKAQEVAPDAPNMTANLLRLRSQYRARIRAERDRAVEELKKAEEVQDAAFLVFAEAAKDEKALALLRIKKKGEYDAEIEQELQKSVDEGATIKSGRNISADREGVEREYEENEHGE